MTTPQRPIDATASRAAAVLTGGTGIADLPPALRLQILTTEHWSLLSTRALSWSEAFIRASMFLAALSGAVVALALVAQVTSFGDGFLTFALLILPVVLFLGVATFMRLVAINHEDAGWVIGMNLLRHAYLEAAPELRPYFVTGWHDDEAGIMATFGARAGTGAFAHELVTTPGVLEVIDGVLASVLAGIVGLRLGAPVTLALGLAVAVGLLTIGLLSVYHYRGAVQPRRQRRARFPNDAAAISDFQRDLERTGAS